MNETREENLEITQGDDWSKQLELVLSQGNISGSTIVMTIRRYPSDADPPLGRLGTDTGEVVIDDGTHATFSITSALSSTFPADASLFYDVSVELPSGQKKTPVKGRLFVGWQAGRE